MAKLSKKKAWNEFSRYVRLRGVLERRKEHPEDNELLADCVTCGRTYDFKKLQAGHWISGRKNATLFSEFGVHCQCYGCNVGKNGNGARYSIYMLSRYGRDFMENLLREDGVETHYTEEDYKEIEEKYKMKANELLNQINQ